MRRRGAARSAPVRRPDQTMSCPAWAAEAEVVTEAAAAQPPPLSWATVARPVCLPGHVRGERRAMSPCCGARIRMRCSQARDGLRAPACGAPRAAPFEPGRDGPGARAQPRQPPPQAPPRRRSRAPPSWPGRPRGQPLPPGAPVAAPRPSYRSRSRRCPSSSPAAAALSAGAPPAGAPPGSRESQPRPARPPGPSPARSGRSPERP